MKINLLKCIQSNRNLGLAILFIGFLSSCCKPKNIPDCEQEIINTFINLKQDLLLPPQIGSVTKGVNGMYGFQYLSVQNNAYQSSIEVLGDCSSGVLWLGWMDINANLNPKWYQYRYSNCDGKFSFTFVPEANFASPTYPYYMSLFRGTTNTKPRPTGAWCEYDDYDAWYIPHWSPIIDGKHSLIADIHSHYNEGDASSTQGYINDAKPYNGEDLEDRTVTGWESVTMRGVVKKAAHPYGDLDVDHLKECKNTYGGIPAEIVYPEKGADWDMYIKPDPDMGYLTTDAKPSEVGCEIEDWTLRDDNHVYRPKAGDYLQTIGKWCIDCGHALNNNLNNGFFTEIHPPEILVASKYQEGVTTAKVIGTGAFKNNSHQFMVWPGPRPSPSHTLKWEILDEAKQNMNLSISALPASNPNHLVCRINKTGGDGLEIDDAGVVYQRCQVIYKARIRCYWKQTRSIDLIKFADLSKYIQLVKFEKLKPEVLKEIKLNDGHLNAKGIIHELLPTSTAKVRYRSIGKEDSLYNFWEEATVNQRGEFTLKVMAGNHYLIVPVAPNGSFTPTQLELVVNEDFLNTRKLLEFNFKPFRRLRPGIGILPLESLVKRYQSEDEMVEALKPILGQLIVKEQQHAFIGRLNLNQLMDANGVLMRQRNPEAIQSIAYEQGAGLSRLKPPFQLIGKDEKTLQFQFLQGQVLPMKTACKVKMSFYSGTDTSGYQLIYETIETVLSDRASTFIFHNQLPYFAGRIGIQVMEQAANRWADIGLLSNWIESSGPSSPNEQSAVEFVYNNDKRLSKEVLNELNHESSEYASRLRMNSHENKNLLRWKPKRKQSIK